MVMTVMDFDEVDRILELMREHELAEFELERDGVRLRLRKADTPVGSVPVAARVATPVGVSPASAAAVSQVEVRAPILGTFYRASGPDAPPFVQVGHVVTRGDVLCIIEAMKLMNEIKSEYTGEVVEIFVASGEPVQYGERLFAIRRT